MTRVNWLLLTCLVLIFSIPVAAQVSFNNPESAYLDEVNNRYFIANAGNGNIHQVDKYGDTTLFCAGHFTRTLGMAIVGDTLYVAASNGLAKFNLTNDQYIGSDYLMGMSILNDIAADTSGYLWITDSNADRIFKVAVSDKSYETVMNGAVDFPNGIIFQAEYNRVLFCAFGSNVPIREIDREDYSISVVVSTPIGDMDGMAEDNDGNIYVSSWQTNSIYKYDKDFINPPELVTYGYNGPADIYYSKRDNILIIPDFSNNRVVSISFVHGRFQRIYTGPHVNDGGESTSACWIDYDNDGWLDIFATNHGYPVGQNNFLFHNEGNGQFAVVTEDPIVNDGISSLGATCGDYDNDSDIDIFMSNSENQNNSFYENDGTGVFAMITEGIAVNDAGYSINSAWGDYDNDGDLDLVVANEDNDNPPSYAAANFLYRNDFGLLSKITEGVAVTDMAKSNGVSWCDYDNDNDIDLFITNGWDQDNQLYINDGVGNFTELTGDILVSDGGYSRGASWGDYDNDSDLDVFVTNQGGPVNFLYENKGDGSFARNMGPDNFPQDGGSFGAGWGDYDNDGDLDLFVTNGHWDDPNLANNALYENIGGGNFAKTTEGTIVTDQGWSSGVAWGDYDRDGDLDLYVTKFNDQDNALYKNNGNDNNWVIIKCQGIFSNRSAIGTRIHIKADIGGSPVWQMREISGLTGFWSFNSLDVHFGLGDASIVDSIIVKWPMGLADTLADVSINQYLTISEGDYLDPDEDGIITLYDNCPYVHNPGQEDENHNDIGDACEFTCGDPNNDKSINILDIVYLINFVYKSGPPPVSISMSDVNSDEQINILDIVYIINFVYKGGPEPDCS